MQSSRWQGVCCQHMMLHDGNHPLSDQPLTVHPAFSHAGANFLVMEPPALNSASCTSPKLQCSVLTKLAPWKFSSTKDLYRTCRDWPVAASTFPTCPL